MPGEPRLPPFAEPFLSPERAIVTPRARRAPDGLAALPLEELVRPFAESQRDGVISIAAPPGGGKRTAIRHLAAVFGQRADIRYLYATAPRDLPELCAEHLVILARDVHLETTSLAQFTIAPWTDDDVVAYASAVHRPRCRSILSRVMADETRSALQGRPVLWEIVIDAFAADEGLTSVLAALRRHLSSALTDPERRRQAGQAALFALRDGFFSWAINGPRVANYELHRVLQQRAVHVILAAQQMLRELDGSVPNERTAIAILPEVIREAATQISGEASPGALRLEAAVAVGNGISAVAAQRSAAAASILLAAAPGWRPRKGELLQAPEALFAKAQWSGVNLRGANLGGTDLSGADLTGGRLESALLIDARLAGARLAHARLDQVMARKADFSGADLHGASATETHFQGANFRGANLAQARLRSAILSDACFEAARLGGADLRCAKLTGANVRGAELVAASLGEAILDGVDLTGALLDSATFRGASLVRCRLEGLSVRLASFRDANLTGSYLTGSQMPGADFRGASLLRCGLAEIDWPGADLRDADLRGASFHLGSTRSGLVGSTIACEGSRTGFYSDDFDDQDFKSPEEIRKANLCDADLRGANIEGVDFYLVDLRGARYTPDQERHFRRCGAILHARAA